MTNWIIAIAIFYGVLTICLGFVLWRIRIVDKDEQSGSDNSFSGHVGFDPEQNDFNHMLSSPPTKRR